MVKRAPLRLARDDAGRAPIGCGSHTATAVPDQARGYLYIYNGGSSGTCNGIDIFRIKLSDPTDADVHRAAPRTAASGSSCHDNNVLLNVGGTTTSYAMCAGGNGLAMYKFDYTLPGRRRGRRREPDAAVVAVDERHDRSLRLVHLRRQVPDLRP